MKKIDCILLINYKLAVNNFSHCSLLGMQVKHQYLLIKPEIINRLNYLSKKKLQNIKSKHFVPISLKKYIKIRIR